MKSVLVLLCVFVVVTMVYGSPISVSSTDDIHSNSQSNDHAITDSAMLIQSLSHMAVVDMFTPLLTALSLLDLQYSKLQSAAIHAGVTIPSVIVPKIDITNTDVCQSMAALTYVTSHENMIKSHVDTATMLAHGIKYITILIINDETDEKTLHAMSSKLNDFLSDYSALISGLKQFLCADENIQNSQSKVQDNTENYIDPVLDIFYSN